MAIMQAQTALTNAEAGLSGATTDATMLAAYRAIQTAADNLVTALSTHGGSAADIAAAARKSGNAKAMADDLTEKIADAEMEANMAMVATAAKLHTGINAPSPTAAAVYDATDDSLIGVTIGTNAAVNLSEDEDATVAANHDWEGMMFTASPDGDGTYEAVVYSNVGEPTPGAMFNDDTNGGYALDATTGETASVTTLTGHAANRVASPSFDQSAGTKTFELATNTVRVIIPGSYRGVAGTYYCTPAAGNACAAQVAAEGFDLGGAATADNAFTAGGGTWTFKPNNPESRFMDVPDAIYASYGWWIHKSEDGETFTASAFATNRGTVDPASGITALQGTATYSGGAAGKYALHSTTGGTNDAGHFTADAMLEADFGDDTITGTINNFIGADGESRNWSVELMESAIADGGGITGTSADAAAGNQMTKWTVGGTAGGASGEWSGTLFDNGDDLVPSIGTGTFYSEFGRDGKMVGAFGVNVDD